MAPSFIHNISCFLFTLHYTIFEQYQELTQQCWQTWLRCIRLNSHSRHFPTYLKLQCRLWTPNTIYKPENHLIRVYEAKFSTCSFSIMKRSENFEHWRNTTAPHGNTVSTEIKIFLMEGIKYFVR